MTPSPAVSPAPVGATRRTMFVIQHVESRDYVLVIAPGSFGWTSLRPADATRFDTAGDAWAAIELRNRTQAPFATHFVIVPVTVTTTPGAEITARVPATTVFEIHDFADGAILRWISPEGEHARWFLSAGEPLRYPTANEAAEVVLRRRRRGSHLEKLGIVPVTQPETTKVVGRAPSTVTVELA